MAESPAKAYYYLYGSQALELVQRHGGLEQVAGRPCSLLDYPCGFGRVLRHLRKGYPDARIVAADINREGVAFCGDTFGAIPVNAPAHPSAFHLGELFDIIFCGSLLTHFSESQWDALLDCFQRQLLIPGRVIFTTTGRHSAEWLRREPGLLAAPEVEETALHAYDETGFGYCDYEPGSGYGIALAHPSWVLGKIGSKPGWVLAHAAEKAWGHNQDVYVLERVHP